MWYDAVADDVLSSLCCVFPVALSVREALVMIKIYAEKSSEYGNYILLLRKACVSLPRK